MMDRVTFEACIGSAEAAIAAQQGGADRVELCANLLEGGTTPSAGSIRLARQHIDIGLQVMIRPRGGDFCYSQVEFEIMKYDIDMAKKLGADGVVIGILLPNGTVDRERVGELVELARPMNITFHRAFDMARDPHQALEALIALGVDRVLTSGQEITAFEGMDLIASLVQEAADRIVVMPGGGIHERNIQKIVERTGVKEVHAGAPVTVPSTMEYRNPNCFMGGELRPPEFVLEVTDPGRIRAMLASLR
jgi:copper homeostasis protein